MKISEIIQRIQSLYSKGVQSDDTRLRKRHIWNKIQTSYTYLLNQYNLKGFSFIDKNAYTTIDCVTIDDFNLVNCPCLDYQDCQIKRTDCEIPEILQLDGKYLINYVGSVDGNNPYSQTYFEDLSYLSGLKYSRNLPKYFIKDNYMYFINIGKTEIIRIEAVFSNLLSIATYDCKNNKCIDILNTDVNIPDKLLDEVIQHSYIELVKEFNLSLEDISNDSKDSHIQRTK